MSILLKQIKETGIKLRNPFKDCGDYIEVYCFNIKRNEVDTILISKNKWLKYNEQYISTMPNKGKYAYITYNKSRYFLHRIIKNIEEISGENMEVIVDHINKNPFDNRDENLRVVNQSINLKNQGFFNNKNKTSGIRGVDKRNGLWRVRYRVNGKTNKIFFKDLKKPSNITIKKERRMDINFGKVQRLSKII